MKSLWNAVVLLFLLPNSAWATASCGGEPGWASREITGTVNQRETFRHETGTQTFVLVPFDYGWRIGMLDRNGLNVLMFSAPQRPVETNPLNLAGWHFRNRENTGPNLGDVNAPQNERRFTFGKLAVDPLLNPDLVAPAAAGEGFGGLGVLTITDFTLTPPAPGHRAGFTSLSFTVCLVWQGGGDRLDPIVDADPGVAFEKIVATMRGCGLDTTVFKLSESPRVF